MATAFATSHGKACSRDEGDEGMAHPNDDAAITWIFEVDYELFDVFDAR